MYKITVVVKEHKEPGHLWREFGAGVLLKLVHPSDPIGRGSHVFLRTYDGLVDLHEPVHTWRDNMGRGFLFVEYPKGTKVTLVSE